MADEIKIGISADTTNFSAQLKALEDKLARATMSVRLNLVKDDSIVNDLKKQIDEVKLAQIEANSQVAKAKKAQRGKDLKADADALTLEAKQILRDKDERLKAEADYYERKRKLGVLQARKDAKEFNDIEKLKYNQAVASAVQYQKDIDSIEKKRTDRLRKDIQERYDLQDKANKKLNANNVGDKYVKPSGSFSSLETGKSTTDAAYKSWTYAEAEARKAGARIAKEANNSFLGSFMSGSSFGHKLGTTVQYALAGSGLYALAGGFTNLKDAIVETDKAIVSYQAILGLSEKQSNDLQKSIFNVGKTYGANLKQLEETALALGRAGVANEQLAEATKVVGQAAVSSGDSMENITEMFVAWSKLYPDKTFTALGDQITYAANKSAASIQGIKTMTSYVLTAGEAAGATSEGILSLITSMKDLGVADSIVGTNSRRLFKDLENSTVKVKNAYRALGVDVDEVSKKMKISPEESNKALKAMFETLGKNTKQQVTDALQGINTLEAQSLQMAVKIGSKFGTRLDLIAEKSIGVLDKTAIGMSLSYEKFWERVKATATDGSVQLEKSFREGFGAGKKSAEEVQKQMKELDDTIQGFAKSAGESLGNVARFLVDHKDLIKEIGQLYIAYKTMVVSLAVYEGLMKIVAGIKAIKEAQIALNLVTMANPVIAVGTAALGTAYGIYAGLEKQKEDAITRADKIGVRAFETELKNVSKLVTAKEREAEFRRLNLVAIKDQASLQKQLDAGTLKGKDKLYVEALVGGYTKLRNLQVEYVKESMKQKTIDKPYPDAGAGGSALDKLPDDKSKGERQRITDEFKERIAYQKKLESDSLRNVVDENKILEIKQNTLDKIVEIGHEYTKYKFLKDDIYKLEENSNEFYSKNLIKQNEQNISSKGALLIAQAKLQTEKAISDDAKIQAKFNEDIATAKAKYYKDSAVAGNEENATAEMIAARKTAQAKLDTDSLLLAQKRNQEIKASTLELQAQQHQFDAQYTSAMAVSDLQANRLAFEASITAQKDRQNKLQADFNTEMQKQGLSDGNEYYDAKNKLMQEGIALIEKEIELSRDLQSMKLTDDLIDNADKLADSFKGMSKGWDKAQKGIQGIAKASQNYMKIQMKSSAMEVKAREDLSTGKITQAEFDEQEAARKQEQFSAELGAYSALAGAAAGFFEEGSKGAKAMQAISATLGIAQGIQAVISAWGSAPFPANMPAVAATTAAVLPMIGQLTSLGGSGGGGGSSASTGYGSFSKTEMIEKEYNPMIDRLDKQIELLESIDKKGSAGLLSVTKAKFEYDRDLRVFMEDAFNSVSKGGTLRKNVKPTDAVSMNDAVEGFDPYKLIQGWSQTGAVSGVIGGSIDRTAMRDMSNFLEFASEATKNLNVFQGKNDSQKQISKEAFITDVQEVISDFALSMGDVISDLSDAKDTFKESFDEITGTLFYASQDLEKAYSVVNSTIGDSDLPTYLQGQIEAIQAIEDKYGTTIDSLLLSTNEFSDQSEILNELNTALGTTFKAGTQEALDFIDSIEMVAESMATSRANINSFMTSFASEQNIVDALAYELGVKAVNTLNELPSLMQSLSGGIGGLTDKELEFLEANKSLIESNVELADSVEEAKFNTESFDLAISSLNDTLSKITSGLSDFNSISSMLISTIEKLRGASRTSEQSLQLFYRSMEEAKALSSGSDSKAYSEAIKKATDMSGALLNSSGFSTAEEMAFAQSKYAFEFEDMNDSALTQIDYLQKIEENTRKEIKTTQDNQKAAEAAFAEAGRIADEKAIEDAKTTAKNNQDALMDMFRAMEANRISGDLTDAAIEQKNANEKLLADAKLSLTSASTGLADAQSTLSSVSTSGLYDSSFVTAMLNLSKTAGSSVSSSEAGADYARLQALAVSLGAGTTISGKEMTDLITPYLVKQQEAQLSVNKAMDAITTANATVTQLAADVVNTNSSIDKTLATSIETLAEVPVLALGSASNAILSNIDEMVVTTPVITDVPKTTTTINSGTGLASKFANIDTSLFGSKSNSTLSSSEALKAGFTKDEFKAITLASKAAGTGSSITPSELAKVIEELTKRGYSNGGYTGNISTSAIAGVVHGKEYVVNAQTTKDLGLNNSAGVFTELLDEIRSLRALTTTVAASSVKSLSTQRAMLGEMTA